MPRKYHRGRTIVYSTRVDPRTMANLARGYEVNGRKFKNASSLINDALDSYGELLIMMAESKGIGTGLRFETFDEAVDYLVNDIRLETEQVRMASHVDPTEDRKGELLKLNEQQKIRAVTNLAPVDENDPAVVEAVETARKLREKMKAQKESALETK